MLSFSFIRKTRVIFTYRIRVLPGLALILQNLYAALGSWQSLTKRFSDYPIFQQLSLEKYIRIIFLKLFVKVTMSNQQISAPNYGELKNGYHFQQAGSLSSRQLIPKANKIEINQPKAKGIQCHGSAIFATCVLIAGVITCIILHYYAHDKLELGIALLFVFFYPVYLTFGCIVNPLPTYFDSLGTKQEFTAFYNQMRSTPGKFVLEAFKQSRQIFASEQIIPLQTIDESGQINPIESDKSIILVDFNMKYQHTDENSSKKLQEIYQRFKDNNINRQYSLTYKVKGFVQRKAFYTESLCCHFDRWFIVFTIFGLILPYSLWLQCRVSRFDVQTKKLVKI